MLTPLEAAQAVHYTEGGLQRVKLPYGGQRCWTSNWLPSMWSARVLYPGDNYHLALAYFQTGMPTEGWELLQGNFLESMYAGVVPGGLASANSSTDFTDIVSIFCRTVVEGLFGYRPNYPNGMVRCAPQFPVSWNHASIATPDFKLRFKQDGNADRYDLELSQPAEVEFMIPARAKMVAGVEVNGQAVDYQIKPGFGQSVLRLRTAKLGLVQLQVRLKSRQPMAEAIQIAGEVGQVVNFPDAAPANKYQDPQGALQEVHLDKNALVGKLAENPGHHILVVQTGELPQWQSYKLTITDPCSEKSRHDKTEVKVPANAQWTCLDLTPKFNGDIRTIYQQQYLSPRPATCSVRLGADGYSPWTFYHWKMTPPPIDLTQVSALLSARGDQLMTPQGVPFRWSGLSNNVAFTSLWDNWPKSISVPVGKSAQAVWLLICGSSNPMQSHVANAEVRMHYADGSEEKLELIPPLNYWSLCPLGGRDYTHPLDAFCLPVTPPPTVQLGGNCRAMVLPWKLKPACKLESITLESLSQEVVVGLMGITLLN
jgi:hypothetical protein